MYDPKNKNGSLTRYALGVNKTNGSPRKEIKSEFTIKARALGPQALNVLETIMLDKEEYSLARISAAKLVLEYAWGKPTQHVEVDAMEIDKLSPLSTEELLAVARAQISKESARLESRSSTEIVDAEVLDSEETH